jgi:hypothetical protein
MVLVFDDHYDLVDVSLDPEQPQTQNVRDPVEQRNMHTSASSSPIALIAPEMYSFNAGWRD